MANGRGQAITIRTGWVLDAGDALEDGNEPAFVKVHGGERGTRDFCPEPAAPGTAGGQGDMARWRNELGGVVKARRRPIRTPWGKLPAFERKGLR